MKPDPDRRLVIAGLATLPLMLRMTPAQATPEAMAAAIASFTGGAQLAEGFVTLTIPMLVENGNSVPVTVEVDSPMTAADHVTDIAVFNELNPYPDTVRFKLTPALGRAKVQTRIRLNETQPVHAVARLSDGTFWTARTNVIVTAPACRED